jgi:hypothetical protein
MNRRRRELDEQLQKMIDALVRVRVFWKKPRDEVMPLHELTTFQDEFTREKEKFEPLWREKRRHR